MLVNHTILMNQPHQQLQDVPMPRDSHREAGPLSAVPTIHATYSHGCVLRVEDNKHHCTFTNGFTVAHLGSLCASNPVPSALNERMATVRRWKLTTASGVHTLTCRVAFRDSGRANA
ncbi:hypothetical protein MRX96_058548 [Rhipicephalus microplus]